MVHLFKSVRSTTGLKHLKFAAKGGHFNVELPPHYLSVINSWVDRQNSVSTFLISIKSSGSQPSSNDWKFTWEIGYKLGENLWRPVPKPALCFRSKELHHHFSKTLIVFFSPLGGTDKKLRPSPTSCSNHKCFNDSFENSIFHTNWCYVVVAFLPEQTKHYHLFLIWHELDVESGG